MLSQEEVLHNSSMLRGSTLFILRGHAKLVSTFAAIWLVLAFFPIALPWLIFFHGSCSIEH
jgi:hypothetical protein